jgi:hypothetical protein
MSDNLTIVRAVYSGLSQRQAAATYIMCPAIPFPFFYGTLGTKGGLP